MLRRESVKGGLGKVYEYAGPGAATLEVPQRATIANMGAEMGATTSIFPADEQVRKFLTAQGRADAFREIRFDPDAEYDEEMELNLSELAPLVACPHLPDNVKPLSEVPKEKVRQVFIGSCYADVAKAAFLIGTALIVAGCGEEKKAVSGIPWNVILMLLGVGMLMNIVSLSGGHDILVSALRSFMEMNSDYGGYGGYYVFLLFWIRRDVSDISSCLRRIGVQR